MEETPSKETKSKLENNNVSPSPYNVHGKNRVLLLVSIVIFICIGFGSYVLLQTIKHKGQIQEKSITSSQQNKSKTEIYPYSLFYSTHVPATQEFRYFVANVDGTNKREVALNDKSGAPEYLCSNDGISIARVRTSTPGDAIEFTTVDSLPTFKQIYKTTDKREAVQHILLSEDGSLIAFEIQHDISKQFRGDFNEIESRVYVMNTNGTGLHLLQENPYSFGGFSYMSLQNHEPFLQKEKNYSWENNTVVENDNGNKRIVFKDSTGKFKKIHNWILSPKKDELIVVVNENETSDWATAYLINLHTLEKKILFDNSLYRNYNIYWSPDGKYLWYTDDNGEYYTLNLATNEKSLLFKGKETDEYKKYKEGVQYKEYQNFICWVNI